MCETGSRAWIVLLIASSCPAADAPAIYQSTPNFSNAIAGTGFDVSWTATPLEVSVDGEITLTIRFGGVDNPDRVRRPELTALAPFKANFREIINGIDPPPDASSVSFTYRLRPRDKSVRAIPELKVAYFSPGSGVSTKYLDEIAFAIKPATTAPAPVRPLEAPERFFSLPDPDRATSRTPSWLEWTGSIAVFAASTLIWILAWRHRNPEGLRLANLRRNSAVRAALDGLDRAERSPEPAAAAMRVFHDYLAFRFGAAAPSPTPGDIARAMAEARLPAGRIADAIRLASDCDASRFAGDTARDLISIPRIRQLILAWEEQP